MISNERQYKISKRQISILQKAIDEFDLQATEERVGSAILALAELEALKSEEQNLNNQILEYENLKKGREKFETSSLADLPVILIKARIAQNLSQQELAEKMGIKEQQIQRYESEEYSTANLKRLLEVAKALKIKLQGVAEFEETPDIPKNRKKLIIDWDKFPIKEMYRRGWFEDFHDSLDSLMQQSEDIVSEYITSNRDRPLAALHHLRARVGSKTDQYALLSWECRIIALSKKEKSFPHFTKDNITDEWISNLIKLSKFSDGPILAKTMLNNVGIHLIIEPHLPSTFLDGAAILYNDSPIIGMTLRYDRTDNFWFVLIHELMHIKNHLLKDKLESVFDDLDNINTEQIEVEADQLTVEYLISSNNWKFSIARYVRSAESVIEFANEMGISPAIVAGRIRKEANNFIILKDLVGQGDIRKYFPDVNFGI